MQKIYVVEDNDSIRELVLYALKAEFIPSGFARSSEFWPQFQKETADLIILDIMLPGEDGLSILKKLKSSQLTAQIPVIMLTAKNSEYDRVRGLDSGADDYITKPFSVLELISRIKAVLRRGRPQDAAGELSMGNIKLYPERHLVTANGAAVTLTLKEFELLSLFLENQGVTLSRERIMTKVWGTDFRGETRTVDMHVKSLRQKLGDGGNLIHTVRGVGYIADHEL